MTKNIGNMFFKQKEETNLLQERCFPLTLDGGAKITFRTQGDKIFKILLMGILVHILHLCLNIFVFISTHSKAFLAASPDYTTEDVNKTSKIEPQLLL